MAPNNISILPDRVITTFDDFVKQEFETISMGVKPSGSIHLGSVMTLLNSMHYLKAHPQSKLEIDVMDLDYDQQRGKCFQSFYTRPANDGTGRLAKTRTKEELTEAVQDIGRFLNVKEERVKIHYFSDFLRNDHFKEMIKNVVMDREVNGHVKKLILGGTGRSHEVPYAPTCTCNYATNNLAVINRETGELETHCYNKECPVSERTDERGKKGVYRVSLDDVGRYNIHYLIDPIRDVFTNEILKQRGAHVFGGDYGTPHGQDHSPKAEKVSQIMSLFNSNPDELPLIYVGPMVTMNGKKMGKSGQHIPYQDITNKDIVLSILSDYLTHGTNIEYSTIEQVVEFSK